MNILPPKRKAIFTNCGSKACMIILVKSPGSKVENENIGKYINHIIKFKLEWQVKQAQEAIRIYL